MNRGTIFLRSFGIMAFAAAFSIPALAQINQLPNDPPDASSAAPAQPATSTPSNTATPAEATPGEPGFFWLKPLGGLGLVLALILGGFFAAKKFAPQYFSKGGSAKTLKVVETLPMGEKRSIAIIEIGDKRFLIGNTAQQITLLAPLQAVSSMIAPAPASAPPQASTLAASASANNDSVSFRNLFQVEKNQAVRNATRPKTMPPEVRAKMQQLRAALDR